MADEGSDVPRREDILGENTIDGKAQDESDCDDVSQRNNVCLEIFLNAEFEVSGAILRAH